MSNYSWLRRHSLLDNLNSSVLNAKSYIDQWNKSL